VANAERSAERQNERLDVDTLRVRYAVVNEGPTLKRFTMAAMGRGTPIKKRTSHVEIRVGADAVKAPKAVNPAATPRGTGEAPKGKAKAKGTEAKAVDPAATPRGKREAKPRAKKKEK
jgi:large subunit ribosomal protein L22